MSIYINRILYVLLCCFLDIYCQPPPVPTNPPYPITASIFVHRYTKEEWNATLSQYATIGGNTVVQRAPPIKILTKTELRNRPDFKHCQLQIENSKNASCIEQTEKEFKTMGINVTYAVYTNNENYSDKMIVCGHLDKPVCYNNGQTGFRLILPLKKSKPHTCFLEKGSEVLVVFTLFNGSDPQSILHESASNLNFSIYFGLPRAPIYDGDYTKYQRTIKYVGAYYEFLERVLTDHAVRYPDHNHATNSSTLRWHSQSSSSSKVQILMGYFIGDYALLPEMVGQGNNNSNYDFKSKEFYAAVGSLVKLFGKKAVVFTSIDLTKEFNRSIESHVLGFETLVNTKEIDVLIVGEGRGLGTGCYYFESQQNSPIKSVDASLYKILQQRYPDISPDVTFSQYYFGSNNQLFSNLSESRDRLVANGSVFEFWLNIDAYEAYKSDDKCGPVDTDTTKVPLVISKTTKQRMDKAISVGGLYPNKIMATSWDPGFTCVSESSQVSLLGEIANDLTRTIVTYCGWHSKYNMSIVLIGFYVGSTFNNVTFYTREQVPKSYSLFGYYYEMDWGIGNHRIPSLVYTQLWDLYDATDISRNGTVTILPDGCYNYCEFTYNYG